MTANAATPTPFPAGTKPIVQFQFVSASGSACAGTVKPVTQIAGSGGATTAGVLTVDPANVLRITSTKISLKVPSSPYPATDAQGAASTVNPNGLALLADQASARWNVCVYDKEGASGNLIAATTYTVAVKPTITSIIPAGSPAAGGQTITVNGTGFSAVAGTTSATVGGVALTNIKVAASGNSFTGTTGPRVAEGNLALIVTAPGGKVSSLDPDNNANATGSPIPFTYSNGISIAPNTGPVNAKVTIDVVGAGFSSLNFDRQAPSNSANAHVFLVKDAYLPATNRGAAECVLEAVLRDTELVCTLDLTGVNEGAYILTLVENGLSSATLADANPTLVTSGATFTVGPY
ncbi:IPT/TIG domain-containing protein [Actinoplanes sp. NPDC048796]|uniref:IPT/TIG domain-containing protein n=1 Tax=Actinoplanes sp. NPDC048796 TaxID=3155640 RepID=UPI0033D63E8A